MDETIGVKGGKNDRRRTLIINKKQKKKIAEYNQEQEIKELEKKVKKQQAYTLIRALPIVIGGGVIKTIHDTATGKKQIDLEIENSKWRIKEYDADVSAKTPQEAELEKRTKKIVVTPTGEKFVIYVPDTEYVEDSSLEKRPVERKEKSIDKKPEKGIKTYKAKGISAIDLDHIEDVEIDDREFADVDFSNLPDEVQDKINKLKSRKIVDLYERQLKDIRYELRKIIYEYNVLVNEDEDVVLSNDAEIILERLSYVIERVEELKSKIKIDDLDKYDDNYIYYLIEGYLEEFRDKNVISEIKDSPLYIMISEKLDELDQKKGVFSKIVEKKRDNLEEKEKSFKRLQERYYSIDKLNNELLEFQDSQDRMLREIKEKVENATSVTEKVQVEFQAMNHFNRRLLRLMAFQMFLPGPKFARGLATSAALHLNFINNIIRPQTTTKKYRVVTVKDYSNEIKSTIAEIDEAIDLLGKTSRQIDKIINEINEKYKDYIGVLSECDEMIRNLKRIKREVEEKEYEMQKVKKQQELELEKNNAKVKTMGSYPVN